MPAHLDEAAPLPDRRPPRRTRSLRGVPAFFPFVQFEFTHAFGPEPGRYVVPPDEPMEGAVSEGGEIPAGEALQEVVAAPGPRLEPAGGLREVSSADVLVVRVVQAPPARGFGLLRRRARRLAADESPRPVPLALATLVSATTPMKRREAARLLDDLRQSSESQESWVTEGLGVLNRAIRAYRAGAQDPYLMEVTRVDPRAVRVGYGSAEDVSNGRWREALALPPAPEHRLSRTERLGPSESMAAVLAGRTRVLDADELLLRGMLDLEHGRLRCAAVQLAAALRSLVAELGDEALSADAAERLAAVSRELEGIRLLAGRAPGSPFTDDERERLVAVAQSAAKTLDVWREESLRP